jgi:hypothetical protein
MFVKLAKAVVVKGTHNPGPKALGQQNLTFLNILPGFVNILLLFVIRTGFFPLPKVSPFYVRMVLKIARAAIVRTSLAGKADNATRPVVCLFHLGVEP